MDAFVVQLRVNLVRNDQNAVLSSNFCDSPQLCRVGQVRHDESKILYLKEYLRSSYLMITIGATGWV